MKNKNNKTHDIKNFLFDNKVLLFFIVLCVVFALVAKTSVAYISTEVFARFSRNALIVLALIIPCLAGLGMNFGITVGAIAAQIAIFWVVHWGFTGVKGMLLCMLISTPLAILFGWLVGKLYNKTKGAEMIAGLVLGFFADGLYRLFVLYIIGGIIPYDDPNLLDRGFGLRNAFDLTGNLKYSVDDISFLSVMLVFCVAFALIQLVKYFFEKEKSVKERKAVLIKAAAGVCGAVLAVVMKKIPFTNEILGGTRLVLSNAMLYGSVVYIVYTLVTQFVLKKAVDNKKLIIRLAFAVVALASCFVPSAAKVYKMVKLPACTYALICLFCYFNNWILDTKLGQDMRTVGQNRIVAGSAGIKVDKIRIIATCISTVLAAWGQLVYLQNLGTFNTVSQQTNVGLYAVASILVGGANVQKAKNSHAIIGVILFHTLFVVTPLAATNIFGDPAVAEYIRMFISYGVIAVSLAMHSWKKKKPAKAELSAEE